MSVRSGRKLRTLVQHLPHQSFGLLVLDADVHDMPARDVLRGVRHDLSGHLPVLFMTSDTDETDIASILNAGADDYVVMPVLPAMLLARVDALLRTDGVNPSEPRQVFGEYEFDLGAKRVWMHGRPVTVTQSEFELALLLFQHLGRPVSRTNILDVIGKRATGIPSHVMDALVSTLRAKLALRPENGYRLTPVHGYGYRLEAVDTGNA